jgi:putative ABC transport system permease protein
LIRDIWGQAWEAMIYNRRRTFITVMGMAWGIATVVLLLAYGAGFGHAIQNIFAQWGTYLIGVFPGRTSEQVGGSKAGIKVRLTQEDVDRLWATVPGVVHISPSMFKQVNVASDEHMYSWQINGYRAEIADVLKLDIDQGRFFSDKDDQDRAHVAVIGSEAKTKPTSPSTPSRISATSNT